MEVVDKLETFRKSMNIMAELCCGVTNAYNSNQAAEYLNQLAESWHKSKDQVVIIIAQFVQNLADKRLRYFVQEVVKALSLPISADQYRDAWDNLDVQEKIALVENVVKLLDSAKGGDCDA